MEWSPSGSKCVLLEKNVIFQNFPPQKTGGRVRGIPPDICIFSPRTHFWAQFLSTQIQNKNGINCNKSPQIVHTYYYCNFSTWHSFSPVSWILRILTNISSERDVELFNWRWDNYLQYEMKSLPTHCTDCWNMLLYLLDFRSPVSLFCRNYWTLWADLIFVIFIHKCTLGLYFFSDKKYGKSNFATKQGKLQQNRFSTKTA